MANLKYKDLDGQWKRIINIRGPKGDKGDQGIKGDPPVRGVDYWTEEDIAAMQGYIDEKIGDVEILLQDLDTGRGV